MPSPPVFPERTLLFFDWADRELGAWHLYALPQNGPPVIAAVGELVTTLGGALWLVSWEEVLVRGDIPFNPASTPAIVVQYAQVWWSKFDQRSRCAIVENATDRWRRYCDHVAQGRIATALAPSTREFV